jgi:hypothetical protein
MVPWRSSSKEETSDLSSVGKAPAADVALAPVGCKSGNLSREVRFARLTGLIWRINGTYIGSISCGSSLTESTSLSAGKRGGRVGEVSNFHPGNFLVFVDG